jgi:hypothetical protein
MKSLYTLSPNFDEFALCRSLRQAKKPVGPGAYSGRLPQTENPASPSHGAPFLVLTAIYSLALLFDNSSNRDHYGGSFAKYVEWREIAN